MGSRTDAIPTLFCSITSTATAIVLGVDVAHHTLHDNVLTTALFVATGVGWIAAFISRTNDEVAQARDELHASTAVAHLKSASRSD